MMNRIEARLLNCGRRIIKSHAVMVFRRSDRLYGRPRVDKVNDTSDRERDDMSLDHHTA
jgi:hypothetical protein